MSEDDYKEERAYLHMDPLPIITLGDEINLGGILGSNSVDSSIFRDITSHVDDQNESIATNEDKQEDEPDSTSRPGLAAEYEYLANSILDSPTPKYPKKDFPCAYCEKRFPQKRLLNRHSYKHTTKFSCPRCKKSFTRKENKLKHIPKCNPKQKKKPRIRAINEKYYCDKCCQQFTRKENYDGHMWRHQGIAVLCQLCEKKFSSLKSFMAHRQLHSNMRNIYFCLHCATQYLYKSNLRRHIRTHQCIKSGLFCENCYLRVKTQEVLNKHQKNSIKHCVLCSQPFCLNIDLQNHRRAFHPDLWFKCKLCDCNALFMAHSEGFLQGHVKKTHNLTLSFMSCYEDGWFIKLNDGL